MKHFTASVTVNVEEQQPLYIHYTGQRVLAGSGQRHPQLRTAGLF